LSSSDEKLPGPLAGQDGEVVFNEAWHAQVMSLAFNLVERGHFSNVQWSEALGAELALSRDRGAPDDANTYYCGALAALEGLLDEQKSLSADNVDSRTEAWRSAYLRTPHGQPVVLNR
jgi:hypothetical protein